MFAQNQFCGVNYGKTFYCFRPIQVTGQKYRKNITQENIPSSCEFFSLFFSLSPSFSFSLSLLLSLSLSPSFSFSLSVSFFSSLSIFPIISLSLYFSLCAFLYSYFFMSAINVFQVYVSAKKVSQGCRTTDWKAVYYLFQNLWSRRCDVNWVTLWLLQCYLCFFETRWQLCRHFYSI